MNFLARWINALLDRSVKLRIVRMATLGDIDEKVRRLETQCQAARTAIQRLYLDLEANNAIIQKQNAELGAQRTTLEAQSTTIVLLEEKSSRLEEDALRLQQEEDLQRNRKTVERIMDTEGSHELQTRAIKLGRMLRPKKAIHHDKIRIGDHADGGYVLLNDLQHLSTVLSLGVAQEVSFDLQLAEIGAQIFQFDYSIEAPPILHDRFKFEKVKIVADENENGRTLKEIAEQHCPAGSLNILKMDVEADEWQILDATPVSVLGNFSQIVCEFHWFGQIVAGEGYERALRVFGKLNEAFHIVHIHANNFGGFSLRGNVAFPEVLEITFAARNQYECTEDTESLPTPLDAPNDPKSPDLWLGHFQF